MAEDVGVPGVLALDHIVLAVADQEAVVAWYVDELGLRPERVDEWRRGEVPFPSVRVDEATVIDVIRRAGERGGALDHLCLVVERSDLDVLAARLDVVEGPVERWGARGVATAVYVRDPDGNVVELRAY